MQLVLEKAGCDEYLTSTMQNMLQGLNAQDGSVHLGNFQELENLLIEAKVDPVKARASALALTELREIAPSYRSLRFPAAVFDDIVDSKRLLICVISTDCSLSRARNNFMFFTEQYEGVVVTPPPVNETGLRFAIKLFGSLGAIAGERVIIAWLRAGFLLETKRSGSGGELYARYAYRYDGKYPPAQDSVDQGFAVIFMSLFNMKVSSDLYAIYFPEVAEENRRYLARTTYRDLLNGSNSSLTSAAARDLGLTEENLFTKTTEILSKLVATIKRSGGF